MNADVRRLETTLSAADRLGALKVRLGIGRNSYRVDPGLYSVGAPTPDSPVLVTANYKLTVDALRSEVGGIDAWILVLDTKGVNVWCAAGKQTFGTKEVCQRVMMTRLDEVVAHRTLILPQLGAPGVAAHQVKAFTEFDVIYGPVRAADIPAFLAAGMQATPEMRQVRFDTRDRFVITGVDTGYALRWQVLAVAAVIMAISGFARGGWSVQALLARGGGLAFAGVSGVLSAALMMLLLPWLPFRSFSAKGALLGGVAGAAIGLLAAPAVGLVGAAALLVGCTTVASFVGMNYTGSSAITSPSGVEYEMRHAMPWQAAGTAISAMLWIVSAFMFVGKGA